MSLRSSLAITALLVGLSSSFAAGQAREEEHITYGDATITGFESYRTTKNGNLIHFVVLHAPGSQVRIVSPKRGLDATCGKAEGDVASGNALEQATLSGRVHAKILRPSTEKGSTEIQAATADSDSAVYDAKTNNLHMQDSVVLHDDDPAASRAMNATGTSADVTLSPPKSKGEAFRSGTLNGPVVMDMKGLRQETGENGAPTKRVPFVVHATSDKASFDNIARTITLTGHVHITSDDPVIGADSYTSQEIIHLNPDGSVDTVEGGQGSATIDSRSLGGP